VQSTEADEAIYHELFVHPALTIHGAPRRVLVSGAGEGATLREVLRHPSIEEILTVDLDPAVVEACREHLPTWSDGAFEDPRVTLRYEDVQHTLANATETFDAVLLDITDPVQDGPSVDLFTTRFFRSVRDALADDGIVVLQAGELDPLGLEPSRAVRSTLLEVFDWVVFGHLHVPSFGGIWSVALAGKQPLEANPPDLEQRYARLPKHALRVYTPTAHRAMLELPPFLAQGLQQPGRVVTGEDADRIITFEKP
jgi:spermidine synthase